MGGEAGVESVPGRGSTFSFTLPCAVGTPIALAPPPALPAAPPSEPLGATEVATAASLLRLEDRRELVGTSALQPELRDSVIYTAARAPQLVAGACTPSPRKLRKASIRITCGTVSVA